MLAYGYQRRQGHLRLCADPLPAHRRRLCRLQLNECQDCGRRLPAQAAAHATLHMTAAC